MMHCSCICFFAVLLHLLMSHVKHLELKPNDGQTWVIGDIHGYAKTFETVMQKIAPSATDRVILLGDLVDRGPDSKGVFDAIMRYRKEGVDLLLVRGNHDDLMHKSYVEEQENTGFLKFIKRDYTKRSWINMGGDTTLQSFGAKKMVEIDTVYYDLIESMYHYIEDENHLYVHAGFDFTQAQPFENEQAMMWIRDFKPDKKQTKSKTIVHGHTPLDLEFITDVIENAGSYGFIALDNGISIDKQKNKGHLLAYETKSKKLIVQSRQDAATGAGKYGY